MGTSSIWGGGAYVEVGGLREYFEHITEGDIAAQVRCDERAEWSG